MCLCYGTEGKEARWVDLVRQKHKGRDRSGHAFDPEEAIILTVSHMKLLIYK